MSSTSLRIFSAVLLLTGGFSTAARADTKSCVQAHASAQREVKAGRLKEAAQLYTACGSDATCPEQLRSECTELLETLRRNVPTVIFSVVDKAGVDTPTVKVYGNDQLLSDGLDGRAVELDPGKYHLRFVLADGSELSSDIVVREAEKNRLVQVRAEQEAKVEAPAEAPKSATPAPPPAPSSSGPPVAAWVATGVAVAGLGTFATFAVLGNKDKQALNDCKPSCPESERSTRDGLKTKFLVADIGLGVGAASAVLATVLFITGASRDEAKDTARGVRGFDVASSPQGASLLLRGSF
ncbi:MAG: hypothetical protein EOO73_18050 [Myxococcales bacterium]|nr:MAG: hypothetical protein EOO73_18050 [Myxococcales bacterium]